MTWCPEDEPGGDPFEPEAFLIPPMEGLLRRLFGMRWGVILVSAPVNVPLEPIIDFLANFSLQTSFYSEFSAELGEFENLQKEEKKIKTVEEVVREAVSEDQDTTEAVSNKDDANIVRHVPRNPELIFMPELNSEQDIRELVRIALSGKLIIAGIRSEGSFTALKVFRECVGSGHLVAASLAGIIAVNTVARNCPECKVAVEYELDNQDAFLLGAEDSKLKGFKGMGCEQCEFSGFEGRIMIHEGLDLSEKLRTEIAADMPLRRIRLEAKAEGMVTLLDSAWSLQRLGETTMDEVVRIADITDPGSPDDIGEPVSEC
jgi:type II secretory ATPase GspE/PulE/Tfp pilus assembly ATPase PilB-like protein